MRFGLVALGLLAVGGAACSDRKNDTGKGGAAGTSSDHGGSEAIGGNSGGGSGGSGGGGSGGSNVIGGSGGGGTGGSGSGGATGTGGYPACTGAPGPAILGSVTDGSAVLATPVTATVTVTSIDVQMRRLHLASTTTSQEWAWQLFISDMPPDLFKMGDTFDLKVDAVPTTYAFANYTSQTVVASRNGALIAFTATLWGNVLPVPALDAWGITVADQGAVCDNLEAVVCGYHVHAARVTVRGESMTLMPGQAATIQGLSFSVGHFETPFSYQGGCDAAPITTMAGFRKP
ncbi:MAG TPA: hypothetical protein VN903_23495 [Polyangia bacterium]|nr:hypothetical protein [Polyangia bacterium]